MNYVRTSMQWYNKQLSANEIKILFGMMDEAHNKIIKQIKKMVADFNKDDKYGQLRPEFTEEKPGDVDSSSDTSSAINISLSKQ